MKPIKRKYLENKSEIINFNNSNKFEIERYFNFKYFNSSKIKLWIDETQEVVPLVIEIIAYYYDYSKKIQNYENFEFIKNDTITVPTNGISKINALSVEYETKNETKILWKFKIKVKAKNKCTLHISIS